MQFSRGGRWLRERRAVRQEEKQENKPFKVFSKRAVWSAKATLSPLLLLPLQLVSAGTSALQHLSQPLLRY